MSIAGSYARALYELAHENKLSTEEFQNIEADLARVAELLSASKDARVALLGPASSAKEKLNIMSSLAEKLRLSDWSTKFLVLMARKERMSLVDRVLDAFRELRLSEEGGLTAELTSAEPLAEQEITAFRDLLSKKFSKKVLLRTTVDPTLIAGMKVTVGGLSYDGTLRSLLIRLKDQLVHGAELAK